MSQFKPTKRFSKRVNDYVKYRPSYPTAVLHCLRDECGLTETAVIADIGYGTGLLAQLFLDNGNPLYGVEPNANMRAAGEIYLAEYANFTSVAGTAEATTLADNSVDFVTAGQAAHWFDGPQAKVEFNRILRPGGVIVFVWNTREIAATPFMEAYETVVTRWQTPEDPVRSQKGGHDRAPDIILGERPQKRTFANEQVYDFETLKGRTLSSSVTPLPGHANYEPLLAELRQVFDRYQMDGRVTFPYVTQLFFRRYYG
ncbi:MAG: class I SAM-dependent methyltransferase [Chloroflexi bacterium]|nr:class I SAM-dependent methyltransferase [Chloroflexota bacterium]